MRRAGLEPVEAGVGPAGRRDLPVLVDHRHLGQVVPLPHLEVVRVVRRRHLHRAGPERRVDELVGRRSVSSRPMIGRRTFWPIRPR